MRKLIVAVGVSLLFLATEVLVARLMEPDAPTTAGAVREAGVEVLAHAVVQGMKFRIEFPQKIDDTTYLENIRAEHNEIVYQLSTNKYGEEFDRMMATLHDNAQESGCSRDDYRKLLAYGLAIIIDYRAANGKMATPIVITPQMCGAN